MKEREMCESEMDFKKSFLMAFKSISVDDIISSKQNSIQGWHHGKGLIYLRPILSL